jgi:hypothetical protein
MTRFENPRPQYAHTGPCCSKSQSFVSAYALRLVGVEVSSTLGVAVPRRRRERFRPGFVVAAAG